MGQLEVSNDNEMVLETFVGSCVALCLFDPYSGIGGMAHIMLPQSDGSKKLSNHSNSAKYADEAVENLLKRSVTKGAKMMRMRAKIAGGANMFSDERGVGVFNIGERNVLAIKSLLKAKGIPLLSEDIGMDCGRHVILDIQSGEVTVTSRKSHQKSI